MCAALVESGASLQSRSTELLCSAGCLSIVVEGADGEPLEDNAEEGIFDEPCLHQESLDLSDTGCDSLLNSPRGSKKGSRRGSRSSTKEETEIKLAAFKSEAAARLNELERLLDEHDQIIRELKRSESTGGLHVIGALNNAEGGIASAPNPATPVDGPPSFITPSTCMSRTAPCSPSIAIKPKPPE